MEQSWFPTHLRVTVIGARNLRAKGKDGLNDCYTVIRLGSDKYMTSVQSGTLSPEWKEECTLQLPLVLDNSDRWTLHLTVKHNNSRLPVDAFLGHVALPIAQLYEDKSRRRSDTVTNLVEDASVAAQKLNCFLHSLSMMHQFLKFCLPNNLQNFLLLCPLSSTSSDSPVCNSMFWL